MIIGQINIEWYVKKDQYHFCKVDSTIYGTHDLNLYSIASEILGDYFIMNTKVTKIMGEFNEQIN